MQTYTRNEAQDCDRETLQAVLRKSIHWHRSYDDGAELEARLAPIETLYQALAPCDLIARHRWLFSRHWPDLPDGDRHGDGRAEKVMAVRTVALDEILLSQGMTGIRRLMDECSEPYAVGMGLAKLECNSDQWAVMDLDQGEKFAFGVPMTQCIAGLLRYLPEPHALALLHAVLAIGAEQDWNPERQARFLVLAAPVRSTWDLAEALGPETDAVYWQYVPLAGWWRDWDEDAAYALRRLSQAQRPRTALQCYRFDQEHIDSRLLFDLLQHFMSGEEPEGPLPQSWDLAQALERIEQSGEIEKAEVIRLEFSMFPALRYGRETRAAALFEAVTSDPAIFTELITLLYKPEHGEREEPITEAIEAAAGTARNIFRSCKRMPGTQADYCGPWISDSRLSFART